MDDTEILKLIPCIKKDIGINVAAIGLGFYEVSQSEIMLTKINNDIKLLLFNIDGKKNIEDIVNIFDPVPKERKNIITVSL